MALCSPSRDVPDERIPSIQDKKPMPTDPVPGVTWPAWVLSWKNRFHHHRVDFFVLQITCPLQVELQLYTYIYIYRKSVSWKGFLWRVAGCYCFRFVPFCSMTSLHTCILSPSTSIHVTSCWEKASSSINMFVPKKLALSISFPLCQFLIVVLVMFLPSTSRDPPRNGAGGRFLLASAGAVVLTKGFSSVKWYLGWAKDWRL